MHPTDRALGLYFAQARMYDAGDRRFMAVDPVKGAISIHSFLIGFNRVEGKLPILYNSQKTYVNLQDLRKYFMKIWCKETNNELVDTTTILPQTETSTPTKIDYVLLTNEQKKFLATIAGEALNTSGFEIQACASVVMNRKKHFEWRQQTIERILNKRDFNAVDGPIFKNVTNYMNIGTWPGDTSGLNTKKFDEIVAPLALAVYDDEGKADYAKEAVFFTKTGRLYYHGEKVDLGDTEHDFYKHICERTDCFRP